MEGLTLKAPFKNKESWIEIFENVKNKNKMYQSLLDFTSSENKLCFKRKTSKYLKYFQADVGHDLTLSGYPPSYPLKKSTLFFSLVRPVTKNQTLIISQIVFVVISIQKEKMTAWLLADICCSVIDF